MDQPYSIVADWLSKFHTWPEFIQALWVIAIPVTVLGTAWIVMREVREIVVAARGEGRGAHGLRYGYLSWTETTFPCSVHRHPRP